MVAFTLLSLFFKFIDIVIHFILSYAQSNSNLTIYLHMCTNTYICIYEAYKIGSYMAFSNISSVTCPSSKCFLFSPLSCLSHPCPDSLFVPFKSLCLIWDPLSFTWAVFMMGSLEITFGA